MAKLTPEEMAVKDANLARMEALRLKYEDMARLMVNNALMDGIVVTVRLKPNTPLAIGNYRPVVEARFARRNSEYPNSHVVPAAK